MAGRVEGKVAFISGVAMGQGKSHSIRLAQEGAKIIGIDLCHNLDDVNYELGTPEAMADTVKKVEAAGGQMMAFQADVRDRAQVMDAVRKGVGFFGGLDIVIANAGVTPMKNKTASEFVTAMDIDFGGVLNLVSATLEHVRPGGSFIFTGSVAGLMQNTVTNPALGPGGVGYGLAKAFLGRYTAALAAQVAPDFIRVNTIHPTNVNTNLLHNKDIYSVFRPDLANPQVGDVLEAFKTFQAMPVPYVEPIDISNMVLFLASDESRYVTGQQFRVDAGAMLKSPGGVS